MNEKWTKNANCERPYSELSLSHSLSRNFSSIRSFQFIQPSGDLFPRYGSTTVAFRHASLTSLLTSTLVASVNDNRGLVCLWDQLLLKLHHVRFPSFGRRCTVLLNILDCGCLRFTGEMHSATFAPQYG